MPYIKPTRRVLFDAEIEALQQKLLTHQAEEGDYNYVISRIMGAAFLREPRYHMVARIRGVLLDVAAEFYRRLAGPYEDNALEENGDLSEFAVIARMNRDKKFEMYVAEEQRLLKGEEDESPPSRKP